MSQNPNAAGLAINWQHFGSNGHKEADYSRGVLERFTRRARSDWLAENKFGSSYANFLIKSVVNPRCVNFLPNPHYVTYFANMNSVNSEGEVINYAGKYNVVAADKIVINHYYTKSYEEFANKVRLGSAYSGNDKHIEIFSICDHNEVFDDGILKYRAARAENFSFESNEQRFNRVTTALAKTLSAYSSGQAFSLETALTCRALSTYLREKFPHDDYWKICEEASLAAIIESLHKTSIIDMEAQLLIRDLPNLLGLPYPVVKELQQEVLRLIGQMTKFRHENCLWEDFVELDYLRDLLKLI